MRVVELRVGRADFADALAMMRQWLDQNHCPSVRFESVAEKGGVLIRIEFPVGELAERFERDLGTKLIIPPHSPQDPPSVADLTQAIDGITL
jgi:hypothetical protein